MNRRIRDALSPYPPDELVLVSKVGARPASGPLPLALAQKPADLRAAVELDLAGLGVEQIPVVNLRRADIGIGLIAEGDQIVDLDDQLAELITLRDEGKIGALGSAMSMWTPCAGRCPPASSVYRTPTTCSTGCTRTNSRCAPSTESPGCRSSRSAHRFPRFPKVAENAVVQRIAAEIGGHRRAGGGLAWLLAHAPNVLLIAGTTSVHHLQQNLAAGEIRFSAAQLAALEAVTTELPDGDGVEAFLDEVR